MKKSQVSVFKKLCLIKCNITQKEKDRLIIALPNTDIDFSIF